MRTTLRLDDDLHARVAAMARSSGLGFGELVNRLLRQRLSHGATVGRVSAEDFDLETFPATGRLIRAADVQRVLEEDGV